MGYGALDELRKEAWRDAYSRYKDKAKETKRKKGKTKKSDTASKKLNEAKQKATDIKTSTYTLGKAPENLTSNQAARLEMIADIPGLIEGASDGVGLGHEFLRHIERTKVIIHIVDAAGTEGRDPIADIKAIDKELEAYNPELLKKPQVIAANKIDAIYGDENEIITSLRDEFEKDGIKVYPISAVSGQGVRELLFHVRELLSKCPKETVVYEQEFDPALHFFKDEPYTIERADDGAFVVEGPKIEKMLGYTNLDSEKGYLFFQKFQ